MTVDDAKFVRKLVMARGFYFNDPRILAIHQYLNNWGKIVYHIAYDERDVKALFSSPMCNKIKKIWARDGLTEFGLDWLKSDFTN